MEYDNYDNNKLNGGIIALCILSIIKNIVCIISYIILLIVPKSTMEDSLKNLKFYTDDKINEISKMFDPIPLVVFLIISILIFAFVILILNKKKIGIYGYLTMCPISIVTDIILSGFSVFSIILSLIFPIIMFVLFNNKKEIFS